jgi:predicted Zn-dependent peptidase
MKYKKTTLKNGLRIITAPMHETETATVIVMVGVGSRYESEKEAGISHIIEHMLFKGTEKRPTFAEISTELDSIGGEYNAFTGQDRTGYYVKVDAKHLAQALDVVADVYLNSKLDAEELEKEKGAILQEINMIEDMPMRDVENVFEKLLYPQNPLGREISGTKRTVSAMQKEQLLDYRKRFYVANDTVIAVAGKFSEKKIIREITKLFSKMPAGKKPKLVPVRETQKKPAVLIKHKKTDQTHLILGARAFHHHHPDRFALGILAVILGGNMSSRLFAEVREKRGLAYYVRTGAGSFEDCGYLATQAGVEHKNVSETTQVILNEYRKIASEEVPEAELQKAKDFIKGRTVMGLESSDEVASFFVEQELMRKKIVSVSELLSKIDAVSSADVRRVAKKIFQSRKINLAIIGPGKNKKTLESLLRK